MIENQKPDKLTILVLIIASLIGIYYAIFFIPTILQDPPSVWYRFVQNFSSAWTAIPLGVIGLGISIILDAIKKRKTSSKNVSYKISLCGTLIILLGFSFFWFYVID